MHKKNNFDFQYFSLLFCGNIKYLLIIESKGFNAWKDDKHWSSIFAVRKNV